MSKPSIMLSRAAPFTLDKQTTHRITVSLTAEIVQAIQDVCPCNGALTWVLQHAAQNVYEWIRHYNVIDKAIGHPTGDTFISAVVTGRAFQRTATVNAVAPQPAQDDRLGATPVCGGTPTAPPATSDTSSSKPRGPKSKRITVVRNKRSKTTST